MPPAVFITVFVIDAPYAADSLLLDLIATIVSGAVIGLGFSGLGMVLGIRTTRFRDNLGRRLLKTRRPLSPFTQPEEGRPC